MEVEEDVRRKVLFPFNDATPTETEALSPL